MFRALIVAAVLSASLAHAFEEGRSGVPGDFEEGRSGVPGDFEEGRSGVPGDFEEGRSGVPGDRAGQAVFRAETDLVSFGVTVTDRRGNFLADLTTDDSEVLEDGKPQSLKYFIRGQQTEAAPELHLGVMFDTSGSMASDIATARTAAIKFLNALPEAKDITLVDFDSEVRLAKYGQQDFPRLVERIRSRKPDGYTAMYDALGQYVTGTDGVDGRKVLVLFSDGGDTRSRLGFTDVVTLL